MKTDSLTEDDVTCICYGLVRRIQDTGNSMCPPDSCNHRALKCVCACVKFSHTTLTTLIEEICLHDIQLAQLDCTTDRNGGIVSNYGCSPATKSSAAVVHDTVVVVADTE